MAEHFIVYAARQGAKSVMAGICHPTYFTAFNKILDDRHYLKYKDPRHGETFRFESLFDFITHPEGLNTPDWLPFMKALKAQDEGSAAKALYWRMLEIDGRLNPLPGAAVAAQPLAQHGEMDGKRRDPKTGLFVAAEDAVPLRMHGGSRTDNIRSGDFGTSQTYLLRRLARDAPEILERVKAGEFKSARAAAIEAGIIKPIPSVQLKEPSATAQKVITKKGREWSVEFAQALLEQTA